MGRPTTRHPETDDDEEELEVDDVEEMEDDDDDESVASTKAAPVVSDSRRRRLMKRGEYVEPEAEPAQPVVRKDRPTPSQREEVVVSKNPIVRFWQKEVEWFKETRAELAKVTWLSREETIKLARIVITVTTIAAIFLGTVSFLFGYLTQLIATQGSTLIAGIIAVAIIIVVTGLWLFRETLFGGVE